MATKPDRWYFSREQLLNSPTIKCGIEPERELSYRQQAANLIQDMGQRLQVYQLCINTAIVYMHRFYMYHSFTKFPRNSIAAAALFLAAKVEEQPHKLEHVIRVSHACLHRGEAPLDPRSNTYAQQAQELVINESIILQTLGFEVGVVHPHTHVVKCTQMIRASKDLSQSSYFLATNSLHLTTFCLKYKPTVVACVCIHLACKWTQWEIPKSNDGKEWWEYVDPSVTEELLNELTREFLRIIDGCPLRLKKRIMGYKQGNSGKDSKKTKTDVSSTNDSAQQQQPATSSQGSVDSGIATSSSADAFDYSFDSKPASGFDQYSDSEESKTEESSTQKTEKTSRERTSGAPSVPKMEQPRKQETVKVSLEQYKRKLQKQPQLPSSARADKPEITSLGTNKPLHKESKHSSHKLGTSAGLKERAVHGIDKNASGQRNNPSHERTHTGHDRIHQGHDKFALCQDKQLHASERTVPGHESVHTSQTRGPSGPDRLPLGHERSASSQEKTCPSGGRAPSSSARALGHEKLPSSHRSKPNEKQDAPVTTIDAAKHSLTGDQREKREQKRSEIPIVPTDRSKEIVPTSSAKIAHSSMGEISKEHEDKSYAQAVKELEWSDKVPKKHRHVQPQPHHTAEFVKQTQSERISKPLQAPEQISQKESLHEIKQETSQSEQANMDMFNEISAELLNDLKKDSLSSLPSSPLPHPVPESVKREPKISSSTVFVPMETTMQNSSAPLDKPHMKPQVEELTGDRVLQQAIPPITNVEKREYEDKQDKQDNSERKEEREKRKEGHKSKREDKKHHRSHKHRHHSPSSSRKQGHEVEVAEASGDRVPAKKQKMEQADSPHTVLTTSKGIKLKIKGLSNSFNNGNDQRNGKEHEKGLNANTDSPGLSLKLTLSKVNSPNTSSPRDSSRDKDPSNHHRTHHKHKSRHHRNKESHQKRPRSPGLSSASDASPVISPAKKRSADTFEVAKPLPPPNQSLLNLPMPPDLVKARRASPNVKHAKRKRESYPLLPAGDVPPPPPPPQYHPLSTVSGLPPMQYATLDTSVLYGDFKPPLPSGIPMESRPPPPPPIPPPQKRPPLPP